MKCFITFVFLLSINFQKISSVNVDLKQCSFSDENRDQCFTNKMNMIVALAPRMREKSKDTSLEDVNLDKLNMDIGTGSILLTNVKLTNIFNPQVEKLTSYYNEIGKKFRMDVDFITESTTLSCYANINIVFRGRMAYRKPLITQGNAYPRYTLLRFNMIFDFDVHKDEDGLNYLKHSNSTGSFQCRFGMDSQFNFKDKNKKNKNRHFNTATVNVIMSEHSYEFCMAMSKKGDILGPFYKNFIENMDDQFEDFGILD